MDSRNSIQRHLPELLQLQSIMDRGSRWLRAEKALEVSISGQKLPVWVLELGNPNPKVPVLALFGGVHGVERIGSQILLAWLHTLVERLHWDDALHQRLARMRLVVMPMVNPGGMWMRRRSNPNGIDLMRNAPIDAMGKVPFLVGGHRLGPWLPWYRGKRGATMEPEAQALIRVVRERVQIAPFSMTLDCHSGFGRRDRLWSCYARSHRPIAHIGEVFALQQLMERTYPHLHPYLLEPQSVNYTTHGDLWDYLYDSLYDDTCNAASSNHTDSRTQQQIAEKIFLPFTLEMGSWLWVRKNPKQMLDFLGYFNPVIHHRHHRVLRQHMPLLDFLTAATSNHDRWLPLPKERADITQQAIDHWFGTPAPEHQYPPQ